MSAHNDTDLESLLKRLRENLGAAGKSRSKIETDKKAVDVSETLRQIQELVNVQGEELTQISRTAFIDV